VYLNKTYFKKPFLMAGIGIKHNSSVKLAKNYVFDAVKLKKKKPDISTPESQKLKIKN
tara:strand:+ start:354 stop:527 length:174 start_codon:yes stop_codon:yes gene_type:complete